MLATRYLPQVVPTPGMLTWRLSERELTTNFHSVVVPFYKQVYRCRLSLNIEFLNRMDSI